MTRRALGTLSVLLIALGAMVWVRANPDTPNFRAKRVSVLAEAPTTSTAPPTTTTEAPPPPPPTAPRAPVPPPAPPPPAVKPLSGPFWVAAATVGSVEVYDAPNGTVKETVSSPNEAATTRVFLVKDRINQDWVQAYMPTRPNGHTGYLKTSQVSLSTVDTVMLVERRYHRLTLWTGDVQAAQVPVAIGKSGSPTPSGLYYMQMLIATPNASGAYGPYVFGLSAHSEVYETFGGGDGLVGLHGTNQPSSVGTSASHGCLRVSNSVISRFATTVPVGTPIVIV